MASTSSSNKGLSKSGGYTKMGMSDEELPVSITTDTSGQIKVLPPRTAEEIVAREREKSKDHLAYGPTRRS
ncbi:hypothetical protein Tco_0498784 [Tanacetum coccineum]